MKISIALFLILAGQLFAQPNTPPDTLWTKAYGTVNSETGYGVCQAADGGLCIVGEQGVPAGIYTVRTTGSGDTLWTRRFVVAAGRNVGYAVKPTPDNGFVIGGQAPSASPTSDFLVMKISGDGEIVWSQTFGGNLPDLCTTVWVNQDGTILAAGYRSYSASEVQGFVAKFAANGDTLWTRTYGGAAFDRLSSIASASTGYILCGLTNVTPGGDQLWLLRIDENGQQIWSRNYGGAASDDGYSAKMTVDGGFVAAGFTSSFGSGQDDYYLVRTNAQGDTLWTRVNGTAVTDRCYSVLLASDGGYVLGGFSGGQNNGTTNNDLFIVKYSSVGVRLWEDVQGGQFNDFCYSMEKTQDGGFVSVGMTNSFGSGSYDYYAVRMAGVSGVGGLIRDEISGLPIQGAVVQEFGNSLQAVSDTLGHYILSSFPGTHDFIIYGQCVERDTIRNFTVITDSIMELDFEIGLPQGSVPQTSINILAPNHAAASENLLIYNHGAGLLDWRVTYRTLDPPGSWLTITPSSGSVATGDSAVVQVTVRLDTINVGVFDLFGYLDVHLNSCPDSVWHVNVQAAIVNAADEHSHLLPEQFALTAYPNPFNPQTTIEFTVPQPGPLSLVVYDMTGRRVAQLVEEDIPSGVRRIAFDGSALASGIYFARMESHNTILTQKLLLLK